MTRRPALILLAFVLAFALIGMACDEPPKPKPTQANPESGLRSYQVIESFVVMDDYGQPLGVMVKGDTIEAVCDDTTCRKNNGHWSAAFVEESATVGKP